MVSRETLIRDGLIALGLEPEAASDLDLYCDLIESDAIPKGFLGPRESGRLVGRHIIESAWLDRLLPAGVSVIDVGSGAGLPGIVLAVVGRRVRPKGMPPAESGPAPPRASVERPVEPSGEPSVGARAGTLVGAREVVLLEAEGRRADFLDRAISALGLGSPGAGSVHVVRARAEDAGRDPALREAFAAAVARALANPPVALELTMPFVRTGGVCVLHVGPSVDLSAAAHAAHALAGGEPELVPLQVPGLEAARRAMIVRKIGVTPERYPRRAGVPARRPLG
jgi:16S rRNA G527 N7-methylase RsmG